MVSGGCGGPYPECPFWYDDYCPGGTLYGYAAVPADLPHGLVNDNNICYMGMLPANFGSIDIIDWTLTLTGMICEFGIEIIIELNC